jgi:GTPase SAR1 family protein
LIKRYVHNIPPSKEHHTTIGVEFSLKTLKVDDEIVNVQVWYDLVDFIFR